MENAHETWISNQLASISEFARTVISADLQSEAAAGDYSARLVVAGDVASIARWEAMSCLQLDAEQAALDAETGWNPVEGKFEVNDIGYAQWASRVIDALREFRADKAAEARWTVGVNVAEGLTHRPFAVLAGV